MIWLKCRKRKRKSQDRFLSELYVFIVIYRHIFSQPDNIWPYLLMSHFFFVFNINIIVSIRWKRILIYHFTSSLQHSVGSNINMEDFLLLQSQHHRWKRSKWKHSSRLIFFKYRSSEFYIINGLHIFLEWMQFWSSVKIFLRNASYSIFVWNRL